MTVRPHHRRQPFHRRQFVVLVVLFSLIASACGLDRSSGAAATVSFADGTSVELLVDDLDSYYDSIVSDDEFVAGAYGGAGVPPGLRASILGDMVIGAVFDDVIGDLDVTVSPENAEAGTDSIEGVVASLFPLDEDPTATAQARFETLPYLPFLASLQSKQFAIGDALVEASGGGETIEVPCASHILLVTEEEANDVVSLLDDGGDFAELAMEFSTGPSGPGGGDLGCADPGNYVPEFGAAIIGADLDTIIGPVETEFGFHVITVYATEEQTIGAPDPQALVNSELQSAVSQITVDVDPLIGTWDATQGQVIPPS